MSLNLIPVADVEHQNCLLVLYACMHARLQQAQLTRLAFNPHLPLLLVGDDKCASMPVLACDLE